MKLSIIIVSFNVKSYLEQCLVSVRRACRGIEAEVWVVDNASSDGTVDYIAPRFPEVRWIKNTENKGFSRANNMAIARSEGEYVLLLNPDTIVGEDVLAGCLAFMDAHPRAGATGVAMLKDDGDFVQIEIEDNGKGIAARDLPNIFERFYRTDSSRNSSKGGSGIGLSIVKKIIEDHGGRIWATSKEGIGTVMHIVLRKYQEVVHE